MAPGASFHTTPNTSHLTNCRPAHPNAGICIADGTSLPTQRDLTTYFVLLTWLILCSKLSMTLISVSLQDLTPCFLLLFLSYAKSSQSESHQDGHLVGCILLNPSTVLLLLLVIVISLLMQWNHCVGYMWSYMVITYLHLLNCGVLRSIVFVFRLYSVGGKLEK